MPVLFARRFEKTLTTSKDGFAIRSTQPKRPHKGWESSLPSQWEP